MTGHQGIQPFRIAVPDAQIEALRRRLLSDRPPAGPTGRLARRWVDGYDWRKHEAKLNDFPQFTTEVEGARVHFVEVRCDDPGAGAVLLLHGWPGSVADVLDDIAPLARTRHVVAPSLPGHGFSGPLAGGAWSLSRMAGALGALMRRLGHERYEVRAKAAGGAPRRVGARPQAPGDSPIAELAWLVGRIEEWTDLPESVEGVDRILTGASIGWFTHTTGTLAGLHEEWASGIRGAASR